MGDDSPVTPSSGLTIQAQPSSQPLAAMVGTTIPELLRVEVRRGGTPAAGVRVVWGTSSGRITPSSSLTDAAGMATATWTVGGQAGAMSAWAGLSGRAEQVTFLAGVLPGPLAGIEKVSGDAQTLSRAQRHHVAELAARPVDAFGNPLTTMPLAWRVESGPVELAGPPVSIASGTSVVRLLGTGAVGTARVVARAEGSQVQAEFRVEFEEGPWMVAIANFGYTTADLVSRQNSTRPPVDTMPVGATMVWVNQDYWDALGIHQIEAIGTPAFPPCAPMLEYDAICTVTFTVPGTYRYGLVAAGLLPGVVVVR